MVMADNQTFGENKFYFANVIKENRLHDTNSGNDGLVKRLI